MSRRDLLTEDERARLFGIPLDEVSLVWHYMLSPFMTALDAPPRRHARLHRLLDEPSVFDGAASDRRLDRHPE